MSKIDLKIKKDTEQFYKNAYCAKSAKILPAHSKEEFKVVAVIEIDSGDSRGVFHIATVQMNEV